MSLEMIIFVRGREIPERGAWQHAIDSLGLPVKLDAETNLAMASGFSPAELNGTGSGFEIHLSSAREVLSSYPQLSESVADRDRAITFSWGGDLAECACVLAATAALVKECGAVAYYPSDDILYEGYESLVEEARQCF